MRYIDQLDIREKRVLLRADLNVPLDEGRRIADDARIVAALPTIRYILEQKSKLIIISHLDRPGGKVVPDLSLAPIAERLSELLKTDVPLVQEGAGPGAREAVGRMTPGSTIMLENLRFDPGEEADSDQLASDLADLADVYIDDAFGTAHRSNASNVGVTRFLTECGGGFLMKKELYALDQILVSPKRPLVAVVGGAKVASKLKLLENLTGMVDRMLLGGVMASTFLKAKGLEMGDSFVADGTDQMCLHILKMAEQRGARIVLPSDLVVTGKEAPPVEKKVVTVDMVKPGEIALDIGPQTIRSFLSELDDAATILWNGPMGKFEEEPFAEGTRAIGEGIARSSAYTLVGGGDTGLALKRYGLADRISYISTGGGAFLEILAGRELPAIKALEAADMRASPLVHI